VTPVALRVNGRAVQASVEPRTHLADFLRGRLLLTGTHLGCEQGVCGACTVSIDGRPQRACIAYVVDCDGSDVTTIEGYDDDPLMAELREAFAAHHALQCGFCTPGMLATARDIVLRLGDVPEARIREELSGNLCRCTGYVGIVAAIRAVCAGRRPAAAVIVAPPAALTQAAPADIAPVVATAATARLGEGGTGVEERILIAAAPDAVWAALADLRRVAACLPGAEITEVEGELFAGRMRLALGPIRVAFAGQGEVSLDPVARQGRMRGRGRDAGTGSSGEGEAVWRVSPSEGTGSVVDVTLSWRLTGVLAQFNRAALVQDLVRRLAASFAANLQASIAGAPPPAVRPLGLLALIWSILRARLFGRDRGA